MRWGHRLQLAAVVVFIAGYAGLSHHSNSVARGSGLGAALALAPMLTVGFLLTRRFSHWSVAVAAVAAAALLLYHHWPALAKNFPVVYLLQACGFYGLMALSFGLSLFEGRIALCTRLADKAHGPLTPQEMLYTRRVTAAWTLFFLLVMGTTLGLYVFAPLRVWSLFANFCTLPLVGLMFAAEFAVRRRVLPQVKRGILATVRVYFADSP
jgi:uncharacterized membrane protein